LIFRYERGKDWLHLASETNIDPNTEQKKKRKEERHGCLSLNTSFTIIIN
jgi:hypothetical protein